MSIRRIIDSETLFNEILLGKKNGILSDTGIGVITDMANIAGKKYIERKEGIRLSEKEIKDMIDYTLSHIFEGKKWSNLNPDKLNKKDKYNSTFSYVMTIILCSFANYSGKIAKKRMYERKRVS